MIPPLDSLRRPRARVFINGSACQSCSAVEVVSASGPQAGSFRVSCSLVETSNMLGQDWVDAAEINVAIDFGFVYQGGSEDDVGWTRMITGVVDRLAVDPVMGSVHLDGRDYAARLLDLNVQDSYLNKTSSEIVSLLADQCGISCKTEQTDTLIGQYYQLEHSRNLFLSSSRHANAWDLVSELAQLESYDFWLNGTTLYFLPATASRSSVWDVQVGRPGTGNAFAALTINTLVMERSPTLPSSLQVRVLSWNSRQKQSISASYPEGIQGSTQVNIVRPNLLPDDARVLARTTYTQLARQGRMIRGSMPGDVLLAPRDSIRLSGTGTGWDQVYLVDRIEREMSFQGGFRQSFVCRSVVAEQ